MIEYEANVVLILWTGDRILDTILLQLQACDLPVERDGMAIVVNGTRSDDLIEHLRVLAAEGPADPLELAATVKNKIVEKHHVFLDEELLSHDYASSRLDTDGAWHVLVGAVSQIEVKSLNCDSSRLSENL